MLTVQINHDAEWDGWWFAVYDGTQQIARRGGYASTNQQTMLQHIAGVVGIQPYVVTGEATYLEPHLKQLIR